MSSPRYFISVVQIAIRSSRIGRLSGGRRQRGRDASPRPRCHRVMAPRIRNHGADAQLILRSLERIADTAKRVLDALDPADNVTEGE